MTINYSTNQSIANSVSSKAYPLRAVRSPQAEYETEFMEKDWQDRLEDHMAIYHYHQTALLELARSEFVADSAAWEYGAYLLGEKLQRQSEILLKQRPKSKCSKSE